MPDRLENMNAFLATTPFAKARREPLAGDASNRKYLRLFPQDGKPLVLMDSPPEKGEDIRPFVRVAKALTDFGLSAPDILAKDEEHGFLLLEDLGDALFARVLENQPTLETTLYEAATDVLLSLHDHPAPDWLKAYSPEVMTEMSALSYSWYLRGIEHAFEEPASAFKSAFRPFLEKHAQVADVIIQRDYHAENLLWLPERAGVRKVGLLDFQDAMSGHHAYDLVSLLQDARRDVPQHIEAAMIERYTRLSGMDAPEFKTAYSLLGVQRNLRILGVFARLCLHFGKPHYVDLIPRVWGYLERDLDHPALSKLRDIVLRDFPTPTKTHLQMLKDKCATIPTL